MTKQSLQLSALTLVGSPTTLLRRQYSSALEPKNLFLLVADIYRRISFVRTKVSSFLPLINLLWEPQTDELLRTANLSLTRLAAAQLYFKEKAKGLTIKWPC